MFKRNQTVALDSPSLSRVRMTPQMLDYDRFASRARCQYLPYVMSFNPAGFRSPSINTDPLGFRLAHNRHGDVVSVGTLDTATAGDPVNLLVGASPALGYGSTSDASSVVSRLAAHDPDGTAWLNVAGHCYNSVQELMLFILHGHRMPRIKRIVVMGGFNSLVMARLPEFSRGGLPPFYFCGEYFEKFDEIAEAHGAPASTAKLPRWPAETTAVPPIDDTLDRAVRDILNVLRTWRALAASLGADFAFLQQPLATWVRAPCPEERILFDELDAISRLGTWDGLYGDISSPAVGDRFGAMLREGCKAIGVRFDSLVPRLRDCPADDWLFVDRAHFTDHGNDVVSAAIHSSIHS